MTEKEFEHFIDFWHIDYSKLLGKKFKKYKEELKRARDNGNDSERYDREKDEGDTLQQ